jgi:hypothetical protein
VAAGRLVAELDLLGADQPLLERRLAAQVGVFAELDRHQRAQPLLLQARRQQSDRSRDPPVAAQAAKPARDGGRRERHIDGKRIGGARGIPLNEIEKLAIEAVEHRDDRAKFWQDVHQFCASEVRDNW